MATGITTDTITIMAKRGTRMISSIGIRTGCTRGFLMLVCAVFAHFTAPPAVAIEASREVAMAADLKGADRGERLVATARAEGALNLYATMGQEQISALAAEFEKKYGIKVNIWRANSESVLRRAVTEAKGGRFEVDVIESNGYELESLHLEQLSQRIDTPYAAQMIAEARQAHREWIGNRANLFVFAYNSQKVRREELPKTYADLLDPRWKGKLAAEADNVDWFFTVGRELGEERAIKLLSDIVRINGMQLRKGHPLLASLTASGEVTAVTATYNYFVDKLRKEKSAPVDWVAVAPAVARISGLAMSRRAPHPYAAMLFIDFMLSDAQRMLPGMDLIPASRTERGLPTGVAWKFVDPAELVKQSEKWSRLYQQVFSAR
jgi:iron(III) transport system substrate-binding protein